MSRRFTAARVCGTVCERGLLLSQAPPTRHPLRTAPPHTPVASCLPAIWQVSVSTSMFKSLLSLSLSVALKLQTRYKPEASFRSEVHLSSVGCRRQLLMTPLQSKLVVTAIMKTQQRDSEQPEITRCGIIKNTLWAPLAPIRHPLGLVFCF